jgi:hypothetical protein
VLGHLSLVGGLIVPSQVSSLPFSLPLSLSLSLSSSLSPGGGGEEPCDGSVECSLDFQETASCTAAQRALLSNSNVTQGMAIRWIGDAPIVVSTSSSPHPRATILNRSPAVLPSATGISVMPATNANSNSSGKFPITSTGNPNTNQCPQPQGMLRTPRSTGNLGPKQPQTGPNTPGYMSYNSQTSSTNVSLPSSRDPKVSSSLSLSLSFSFSFSLSIFLYLSLFLSIFSLYLSLSLSLSLSESF